MNKYASIIQNLLNIANYIKNKEIALKEVPFEQIMGIIQQVYGKSTGNGELFAELYGIFMIKSLEHLDEEEVSAVLTMLAKHIELIGNTEQQMNTANDKNYRYQCQVAHLLNCEKVRKWHEVHAIEPKQPFHGKGVIYSAITGDYDNVKEPKYVSPDFDYILFTNNPKIKSDIWQVRLVENPKQLDNVRLARRIKIMGHEYLPEYDYSIWVDGKLEIKDNLREYVETYRRWEPILCFTHYVNDCIYKEKNTCQILKKDDPQIMENQMEKYRLEGYPAENGLVESGIMVRDLKDKRMQKVMETWWEEILNGSRRDQLSFNYACWKNDFVYDTTDLFIYGNKYVELYGHNV